MLKFLLFNGKIHITHFYVLKTVLIFFWIFIVLPFGNAQSPENIIYGIVKDAGTSAPLENVNVLIVETSQGGLSDKEGVFRIRGIAEGNYTIQASMTGYKTEIKKVSVVKNQDIEVIFYLQSQTYQIDPVNIIAPKQSRSLLKEPYTEPFSLLPATSIVTNRDIAKQGAVTSIDAMKYVAGGLTETRGRQVKQFFSVRGQKYPYPDYAINGVWQQEFEELPYFFSASDIEEIEIVRSSAALLTGLSGMAGLVNIKTREYISPETNLNLEYGTFNSLNSHLSNGSKIGNFSYAAGVGYDRSDGPAGKHSNEEMANVYTQLKWQPSIRLNIKANLFYLDGKRQLTLAEPPADKRYLDMLQNFNPYRAILSNIKMVYRPLENLSTEVQVFYSFRDPTFNDEVKNTTSNEKDYEYGLNFIQSVSLTSFNTLRFGGIYNHWVAPEGKRFYLGKRCDTETFSWVIVDEQQIGNLTLDGGFRWTKTFLNEYAAFNIEGEGSLFKNVTPILDLWEPAIMQGSLGASYHFDQGLSINFNSAVGQVKPREGSLNVDLEVPLNETRYKFDLGAVKKLGNTGRMTLTSFMVSQKNAIALSGSTFQDTVTGIVRELYVNRDQNQIGLEFEIKSPLIFNMVEPFMNFTLMKSEMKEDGKMVTNKENPIAIAGGGLYMENKKWDLTVLFKYVSPFENERFAAPAAGPQPLGDYLVIDYSGGYTPHWKVPVRFYYRVRNLTNKKYSTVVGYPDFGRMFHIGMQIKFKKEKPKLKN